MHTTEAIDMGDTIEGKKYTPSKTEGQKLGEKLDTDVKKLEKEHATRDDQITSAKIEIAPMYDESKQKVPFEEREFETQEEYDKALAKQEAEEQKSYGWDDEKQQAKKDQQATTTTGAAATQGLGTAPINQVNLGMLLSNPYEMPYGAGVSLGVISPKHVAYAKAKADKLMFMDSLKFEAGMQNDLIGVMKDARRKAYGFLDGSLNLEGLGVDVEEFERRFKVKPSDEMLQYLLKHKPELLEDPKLEAQASTMFAQTAASIIAQAFGGGKAAAAGVAAPGAVTMGAAADLLSGQIENYKKRKDRVHEINAEIMQKHKGDIMRAYGDLDRRTDASEQAYLQQQNRVADHFSRQADQALNQIMSSRQRVAGYETAIANNKAATERLNAQMKSRALSQQQAQELKLKIHRQQRTAENTRSLSLKMKLQMQRKMNIVNADEKAVLKNGAGFQHITGSMGSKVNAALDTLSDPRITPEMVKSIALKTQVMAERAANAFFKEAESKGFGTAEVQELWQKVSSMYMDGDMGNPVKLQSYLMKSAEWSPQTMKHLIPQSDVDAIKKLTRGMYNVDYDKALAGKVASGDATEEDVSRLKGIQQASNQIVGRVLLAQIGAAIGDKYVFEKDLTDQKVLQSRIKN